MSLTIQYIKQNSRYKQKNFYMVNLQTRRGGRWCNEAKIVYHVSRFRPHQENEWTGIESGD